MRLLFVRRGRLDVGGIRITSLPFLRDMIVIDLI